MWHILIVTDRKALLEGVFTPLEDQRRCTIQWCDSPQAAAGAVGRRRPDLAVIDRQVSGQDGLALCRDLLRFDAFVNLAQVSDLDDESFHEFSEGLGLVGRLPETPAPADVNRLLEQLAQISPP